MTPAREPETPSPRTFWSSLGPGLITGAADDDPSGIATYSVTGAQLGTGLLWSALITWPLMAAVQMMCARIGMVTGQGLAASFKRKIPRPLLVLAIFALLAANTINIGADFAGMADAAEMLTHISSHVWVVVFAAAISCATVRFRYAQIAATLKWLALTLFSYVIAAIVIKADWAAALHDTFVPHMPRGSAEWSTLVAVAGTTISPYLFFWQASQEVEEEKGEGRVTLSQRRGATDDEIRTRRLDVGVGTFFSNLVMYFIIFTTAFTLHKNGVVDIQTSRDAASALLPLAGRFATTLYTLGIVGVGLLAIPTLTGSAAYAFAETYGWHQGLDKKLRQARSFYFLILLSTAAGLAMDFSHINPVKALYWSAILNGLLAPFLLAGILVIASDRNLMQGQPASILGRVAVAVTAIAMFAAGAAMFLV